MGSVRLYCVCDVFDAVLRFGWRLYRQILLATRHNATEMLRTLEGVDKAASRNNNNTGVKFVVNLSQLI